MAEPHEVMEPVERLRLVKMSIQFATTPYGVFGGIQATFRETELLMYEHSDAAGVKRTYQAPIARRLVVIDDIAYAGEWIDLRHQNRKDLLEQWKEELRG